MITHDKVNEAISTLLTNAVEAQRGVMANENVNDSEKALNVIKDYVNQQEKKDKLLELYNQVDEFYRNVSHDGDYNDVAILYQQIKAIKEELK